MSNSRLQTQLQMLTAFLGTLGIAGSFGLYFASAGHSQTYQRSSVYQSTYQSTQSTTGGYRSRSGTQSSTQSSTQANGHSGSYTSQSADIDLNPEDLQVPVRLSVQSARGGQVLLNGRPIAALNRSYTVIALNRWLRPGSQRLEIVSPRRSGYGAVQVQLSVGPEVLVSQQIQGSQRLRQTLWLHVGDEGDEEW